MEKFYKVKFAKKTDMAADQYGNESFNVMFDGETDAALWKVNPSKTKPEPEMQVYGKIEDIPTRANPAKTYRKFTRLQAPDGIGGAPQSSVSRKSYSGKQADKEEAIKQGRCYNNAATLVSALIINGAIEPDVKVMAKAVQELAKELHALPDLVEAPTEGADSTFVPEAPDTVVEPADDGQLDMSMIDEMFPGGESEPAPAPKNQSDPGQG